MRTNGEYEQNNLFSKIKIIHVFGALNMGGAETMIMNLYRKLNKDKFEFSFIVHTTEMGDYEKEIESLGGKIYRLPKYRLINHLTYKKECKNLLSTIDAQIIHSHVRTTASIIFKIAKRFNYKTILHSHSTSNGKGINGVVRNILQKNAPINADCKLACGVEAGKWLFGKNSKYTILPNAIKTKDYDMNQLERKKTRKCLGIDQEFGIINVGRFVDTKNHKFLIDVFHEIIKINNNFRLFLVGFGSLEETIKKQVKDLNLENKVQFLGKRNDIPNILKSMDYFLMPSKYEGLPVTLIEAQAAGLSILASDTITDEVDITKTIRYLSLTKKAAYWAKQVIDTERLNSVEKESMLEKIEKSTYNVETSIVFLEDIYYKLVNNNNI